MMLFSSKARTVELCCTCLSCSHLTYFAQIPVERKQTSDCVFCVLNQDVVCTDSATTQALWEPLRGSCESCDAGVLMMTLRRDVQQRRCATRSLRCCFRNSAHRVHVNKTVSFFFCGHMRGLRSEEIWMEMKPQILPHRGTT